MKNQSFNIITSSDLRYEYCVVEVEIDDEFIFRINMENGPDNLEIEFSDKDFINPVSIPNMQLDEFLNLVEKAKKRLIEGD